ncbi:hypothetical protein AsAng_0020950 [Aureispira anguillae]|uniref:Uncharacterized protein n=1 Tax=Aureispira anguillae TaxID=2864201 RepID=A0A916DTD0_9BACT|nr:hypothetical protein AsAng_0020950 [Aureispira anguillae]
MNRHRFFSIFCIIFGFICFSETVQIIKSTNDLSTLAIVAPLSLGLTFLVFRQARIFWKKGGKPSSKL